MGSSQLSTTVAHQKTKPCPLKALGPGSGTFNATCEVTNKIDIDKYFELMKEEYKDTKKGSRPPARKMLARSVSSGNIEPSPVIDNGKNNYIMAISPRRKKNMKKRISCDEKSLGIYAAKNNIKHSETYFNYDLSGHIVEQAPAGTHIEDHHLSKQKSWDLSSSKVKNPEGSSDEDDKDELSLSYSSGDFRDVINNNEGMKPSKSCEVVSNLGERHKHHAMMQGKISSVSEQNRRLRRRYYNKKERKVSDEKMKTSSEDSSDLSRILNEKLIIDNVSMDNG